MDPKPNRHGEHAQRQDLRYRMNPERDRTAGKKAHKDRAAREQNHNGHGGQDSMDRAHPRRLFDVKPGAALEIAELSRSGVGIGIGAGAVTAVVPAVVPAILGLCDFGPGWWGLGVSKSQEVIGLSL